MSQLFKNFLALSFPIKFLVGTIFGLIAGPGLLAFLSEYATYSYAIRINIRPPLEGIPYLSASVALASLVLSVTAIIIFLITRWVVTRMVNYPINHVRDIFSIFDKLEITKLQSGDVVDKTIKSLKT